MSDLGNKQVFATNLKYYLQDKKVSQIEVCQLLDIKPNTFSDWVNAKTYPRIDKIERLANYFGIEKSDLIEKHIENDDDTLLILTRKAKQLTPEQRKKLIQLSDMLFEEAFGNDT